MAYTVQPIANNQRRSCHQTIVSSRGYVILDGANQYGCPMFNLILGILKPIPVNLMRELLFSSINLFRHTSENRGDVL